jgi:D-alanyl-lipoteichoic acid acyltransferase DltB (MBOAT superfamily)
MDLLTTKFAIFFVVVFAAYWVSAGSRIARSTVLTLASYFFFANWNLNFLPALILGSAIDYLVGRRMDTAGAGGKKLLLAASLLCNLALFALFKAVTLYPDAFGALAKTAGVFDGLKINSLAFPIGLAFYLMQSLSYTIDRYRGQTPACTFLPDYLLYVAFFPRLAAGPVVRAGELLPQLAARPRFTRPRFALAIFLLITGLVKKVVIADYLAINLVDKVFDLPQLFSTTEVILAIYAYAVQLTCELSGFTDIALAAALALGLELPDNFSFPFQAANLREFWRRWLTTISTWFRDYVYRPLGGSRVRWRPLAYVNLVVVMLVVGLANGPKATWLAWGLVNGLALAATRLVHDLRKTSPDSAGRSAFGRLAGIFFTFHFTVASFALYRSADLSTFSNLLMILRQGIWKAPNLTLPVVAVLGAAMILMWLPPALYRKTKELFLRLPLPVQIGLAVVAFLLIFAATTQGAVPFVYER